jgi:hypothetical protein
MEVYGRYGKFRFASEMYGCHGKSICAFGVNGTYEKSLVPMEVTGCYGKSMVVVCKITTYIYVLPRYLTSTSLLTYVVIVDILLLDFVHIESRINTDRTYTTPLYYYFQYTKALPQLLRTSIASNKSQWLLWKSMAAMKSKWWL